uniref:Uncharacterized protein n=1 Tax=Corethron hystrix TaxID=216773 RepID=A0A7S1FQF0_9STRA
MHDHPTNSPSSNSNLSKLSQIPTWNPSRISSQGRTRKPSQVLTRKISHSPIVDPSLGPTVDPLLSPIVDPSHSPTLKLSQGPTTNQSQNPTTNLSQSQTIGPSRSFTINPTKNPSYNLTESPTVHPSDSPSLNPTDSPTTYPTRTSTLTPTLNPTLVFPNNPLRSPTAIPSNGAIAEKRGSPQSELTTMPIHAPMAQLVNSSTAVLKEVPTVISTSSPTIIMQDMLTEQPTGSPFAQLVLNPTTQVPSMNNIVQPQLPSNKRPTKVSSSPTDLSIESYSEMTIDLFGFEMTIRSKDTITFPPEEDQKIYWESITQNYITELLRQNNTILEDARNINVQVQMVSVHRDLMRRLEEVDLQEAVFTFNLSVKFFIPTKGTNKDIVKKEEAISDALMVAFASEELLDKYIHSLKNSPGNAFGTVIDVLLVYPSVTTRGDPISANKVEHNWWSKLNTPVKIGFLVGIVVTTLVLASVFLFVSHQSNKHKSVNRLDFPSGDDGFKTYPFSVSATSSRSKKNT